MNLKKDKKKFGFQLVEQEETKPNYIHITERFADVLMAILELESEEATRKKVTERIKRHGENTGNIITDFISKMSEDSRDFLEMLEWVGEAGRHSTIFEIKPDKLVTNPVSACILKELANFSKICQIREVKIEDFKVFLKQQIEEAYPHFKHIDQQEISERIEFLVRIGDISKSATVTSIIWLNLIRYHSQKIYLERLLDKARKEKVSKTN